MGIRKKDIKHIITLSLLTLPVPAAQSKAGVMIVIVTAAVKSMVTLESIDNARRWREHKFYRSVSHPPLKRW